MSEWPLLQLSVFFLFTALILQTMTAAMATRRFFAAGMRDLAWGLFCVALILLIPLLWRPLELALHVGVYDFEQAMLAFCVAFALFLSVSIVSARRAR
ncbi:MAG: hypothetical protein LBO79_00835 [Zoogloeaceae bacterium]|jgi:hypothetical protein|nr:hypothetical protein [Zoogloeaceae bacterium]